MKLPVQIENLTIDYGLENRLSGRNITEISTGLYLPHVTVPYLVNEIHMIFIHRR